MADSDNVLSILAALSGNMQPAAPVNVLQTAGMPPQAPPPVQAPPVAPPAPDVNTFIPADAAPLPTQDLSSLAPDIASADPNPHKRRSVLDTIGQIADVFAKVGGANALYQPTLDGREDRKIALDDHGRKVLKDDVDLATSQFALGDSQIARQATARKTLGTALGALDGNPDAATLWPSIAEQTGIDPQHSEAIQRILSNNPAAAGILAKSLGADKDNLGKNVLFGTDTNGKTVAYQVGPDGHPHILDFGGAVTPNTPIKVVDNGDTNVVVGGNGQPIKIMPKRASPDTVANNAQSDKNNRRTTEATITVAGMPARAKDGTASGGGADDGNVPQLLTNIQSGFNDLHSMNALPGEGGAVNQIEGALGRTALGQKIGEQAGTPSAQKRVEIMKNVSALQQAMLKSLPASATRTKFEQEMLARGLPDPSKMTYKTAMTVIQQLRASYARAVAATRSKTPVKPASVSGRPAAKAGWSVVGVK